MWGMRASASLIVIAALVAGCGSGGSSSQTATKPATKPPPTTASPAPKYVPSAHHAHRPPGSVYNDEVGENILIAPYSRVIELFGPPASRRGKCIRYRIVGTPHQGWEFCFRGERMTGAMVVRGVP
jgi:hypothetical protein